MKAPKGLFEKEIKVYFADTDAAGVVHHSRYVVWLEAARIDLLEHINYPYPKMQEKKHGLVPVNIDIHYLKPLVFGDTFTVAIKLLEIRKVSLTFESYFIKDNTVHCWAAQKLASLDEKNWEIIPIANELTEKLQKFKQLTQSD